MNTTWWRKLRWTAAAVVVLVGGRIAPARACSQVESFGPSFPVQGASDIPLDTLIVIGRRASAPTFGSTIISVASTGQMIPADEIKLEGLSLAIALRPKAPLPPNEEILVGTSHRFRTGTAPSRGGGSWELDMIYQDTTGGGCGDSCGGDARTSARAHLRTTETQPGTIFLVTRAAQGGATGRVTSGVIVAPGGNTTLRVVELSPWATAGETITLVPLMSNGNPDPAVALPVSFAEADGGCAVGPPRGRTSFLPLTLLGLLIARLMVRRRR